MAEEEEPKANRIDRFKELEAKQREKEGLSMVPSRGLHTQPAATPPRRRAAQNSNNSRKYSHVRRRSPTNSVVFKAPKSPLLDDTEDEGTSVCYHHLVCASTQLHLITRLPPLPNEQRKEEGAES